MRASNWIFPPLLLALAACQREPAPAAAPATDARTGLPLTAAQQARHWWVCGPVQVSTEMRGEMLTLSGPFGERELSPRPCDAGHCYGDDQGNEFWNQGEAASLKLDWKDVGECTEDKGDATSS